MAPVGQIDHAAANASCLQVSSDPSSGIPPCLVAIEHDRDVPAGEQLRPSPPPMHHRLGSRSQAALASER
jgi:hypothetical protein